MVRRQSYSQIGKAFCVAVSGGMVESETEMHPDVKGVIQMTVAAGLGKTDPYDCYGDCQSCEVYAFSKYLDKRVALGSL